MDITHITSLLGGIALFLYGMSIMGAGLEKLAGGKMQGVFLYVAELVTVQSQHFQKLELMYIQEQMEKQMQQSRHILMAI